MKIGFLKEDNEKRLAIVPQDVKKLASLGISVFIESNFGKDLFTDIDFSEVGAEILDKKSILNNASILCQINPPHSNDIKDLQKNSIWISLLDPFRNNDLFKQFNTNHISSLALDMIPRITRAQKMDVLSSQASLAGYVAVLKASAMLPKVLPMMMTPAGTLSPSRVFIIGAGVAGLQAIATAKRLGARVEAFDTRAVVEEQVQSLGAKFVKVDLGETGQTKDGYAKALTDEQIQKQRDVMAKHCAMADIVITTAQVFGKPAPLIITQDMVNGMQANSIIVDLAVDTGGNVAGSKANEIITTENGVKIIGFGNLPEDVAYHASQMLSANIVNLIQELVSNEEKRVAIDLKNDIINGCLLTHNGETIHSAFKGDN